MNMTLNKLKLKIRIRGCAKCDIRPIPIIGILNQIKRIILIKESKFLTLFIRKSQLIDPLDKKK